MIGWKFEHICFNFQVAGNRCWSCGLACLSNQDLQNHLHEAVMLNDVKPLWDDDQYLKPFMQDDSLLFSFNEDEEGEDDFMALDDQEEIMKDLSYVDEIGIEDINTLKESAHGLGFSEEHGTEEIASTSNGHVNMPSTSKVNLNGIGSKEDAGSSDGRPSDKHSQGSLVNLVARDVKKVNENYFGAYSSFGIHREMLSDKVQPL